MPDDLDAAMPDDLYDDPDDSMFVEDEPVFADTDSFGSDDDYE